MMRRKKEKGEEPMKCFGRVEKIGGVLASLGVTKSDADVNRRITLALNSDYEIEEIPSLYREGITRSETVRIIRQRYLRIPSSK